VLGTVTVVLWLIVAPAPIDPVACGLPTLFDGVPYPPAAFEVVIRTCEFEVLAAPLPLLRICQLTDSDPPGATLLLPSVTFKGCTSTVATAAVTAQAQMSNTIKLDTNSLFISLSTQV
jgi:hypothetical protein